MESSETMEEYICTRPRDTIKLIKFFRHTRIHTHQPIYLHYRAREVLKN